MGKRPDQAKRRQASHRRLSAPEELKKFMEQYEAKKNNRQPDLSDYKEYKLKEDNIGFQMLQNSAGKRGRA